MRENFKLRKMKIGLVSIGMAAMFITIEGQADASEHVSSVSQSTTYNGGQRQVAMQPQLRTEGQSQTTVQAPERGNEKQTVVKEEKQKNFLKLDKISPGATEITGETLPNQTILLNIDNKSVDSVEDNLVKSDSNGYFTYKLNDRKIVYNQEVEITSSNFNLELDLESETEESAMEEESNDLSKSVKTGRYDKAYEIPPKQLEKIKGHHQVWVEPILKDSGIIKGHTSVKGRVALAINNKFVNLSDSSEYEKAMSNESAQSRVDGIWKHIDNKGYFEFDFKRKPLENFNLKKMI